MSSVLERAETAFKKIIGTLPYSDEVPISSSEFESLYATENSFTQYLPWVDYDEGVFLFDDDVSVGALIELFPADVDGRPEEVKDKLEKSLTSALSRLPEKQGNPWVIQIYLQDEPIVSLISQIREYATPEARKSKLHAYFMDELEQHIKQLSNPEGLFLDEGSGVPWSGKVRRVRCCLYRRQDKRSIIKNGKLVSGAVSPTDENINTVKSFRRALDQAGIRSRLCNEVDMWHWMLPWFTPKPKGYEDAYEYINKNPFHESGCNEDRLSIDLVSAATLKKPKTDVEGNWYFTEQIQRYVSIAPLDAPPHPGILTGERQSGAKTTMVSTWDQLPSDSIFVMTIVVEPQINIKNHCHFVRKKGGNASPSAEAANEQIDYAMKEFIKNKKMYRMSSGIYVRANTKECLDTKVTDVLNILSDAGLKTIDPDDDPIARDSFVRNLPMVYSPQHDKVAKRARLTWSHHISRILPLFGRSTGTGNPGSLFFNSVGQALTFDPFNKRDRVKTAHGLIFGNTGAGKSALINYLSIYYAAMFNPRQFIIEKGSSFRLLGKFFRRQGKRVEYIKFTPQKNVCPSLPPYVETKKAIEQLEEDDALVDVAVEDWLEMDIDEENEERFYLGEMEQATILMITNADKREIEKMSSDERQLVRECIVAALRKASSDGEPHARPQHVVDVMDEMVNHPPKNSDGENIYDVDEIKRIRKFARSLKAWTQGLRGLIFNRYGEPWKEADLTIVDMGILTNDNNEDMLAVAIISLVNTITGIGEKYQFTDKRETVVWTDEGHVITTNPTIVKPFVFGVKTWRKLGIWLIQGTQNLTDYPDEAQKMLSLAEWWYCLNMSDSEINEMSSRFRTQMTEEQKALCLKTSKQSGAFVEGVVMSDKFTFLFRSVMPALALALAMTDGDEKKLISKTKNENQCDDYEAALLIAEQIKEARNDAMVR